jgi:short-subunit dehydrogenase
MSLPYHLFCFPFYSIYSATKAFVFVYLENNVTALEGAGILLITLCPDTVQTLFHSSNIGKINAISANKP